MLFVSRVALTCCLAGTHLGEAAAGGEEKQLTDLDFSPPHPKDAEEKLIAPQGNLL